MSDIRQELNKIFRKYKISGIIKIPNNEVMSIYQSDADKLEILEIAEIDKRIRQKLIEQQISEEVFNIVMNTNTIQGETLSYLR